METKEKKALLENVDEVLFLKDENVSISFVLTIVGTLSAVLLLFVPKIYLANNIYKNSIEIERLNKEYASLRNENKILNNKIAQIKYNNGVTH